MLIRKITMLIAVTLMIAGSIAAGAPESGGESDNSLITPLRTTMDRTFVESPNYHKGLEAPPGYAEKVAELKRLYGDDALNPGSPDNAENISSQEYAMSNGACSPCVERQAFVWDTSVPDVETILGYLYPRNASNPNDVDFAIYFEREIDLDPSDDLIEFIVEPYDNGTQNHLWIAFFDEGRWLTSNPSSCPVQNIDVVQTSETAYEYYLNIRADGVYEIGLKNTSTNVWEWITCDDSDNPGEHIGTYHASSEIYASDFSQDFYASARIRDDWTWVAAGDSRRPKDTFNPGRYTAGPHVSVTYSYDSSKRLRTYHSAFD